MPVSPAGRARTACWKSLFRNAEEPFPHPDAPHPDIPYHGYGSGKASSACPRFLFHEFPLSKIFTSELHKYAFRDLTERQRKDKHPYTISPRHPSISHTFMTPPQWRQPVETQNLASHEKVSTIHTCNNQTVIIIFPTREAHSIARHTHDNHSTASALLARETHSIASHTHHNHSPASALLACEAQPIASHTHDNQSPASGLLARETQPIARHTHHNHSPASALLACETQDFASLLLGRQRGKLNHIYCWKNRSAAGKTMSAMTEAGIRRCRRHCAAEAHRHNTVPHDIKQKGAAPHGAHSINLTNKIKLLIFHFNGRIRIVRLEHVLALGERRLVAIAHVAVGYGDVLILILQV